MEPVQESETEIRVVRIQIHGDTREDVVKACEELRRTHRLIISYEPQKRQSGWMVNGELLIVAPT